MGDGLSRKTEDDDDRATLNVIQPDPRLNPAFGLRGSTDARELVAIRFVG